MVESAQRRRDIHAAAKPDVLRHRPSHGHVNVKDSVLCSFATGMGRAYQITVHKTKEPTVTSVLPCRVSKGARRDTNLADINLERSRLCSVWVLGWLFQEKACGTTRNSHKAEAWRNV